jgi:hypothetical protein
MKKLLSKICKQESGQALLIVLVMLTIGSLMLVPTLNSAATNAKIVKKYEKNFKAYYAAEAGVEDAIWKVKSEDIENLPYAYSLPSINGLAVNVTIADVTEIAGVEIGAEGVHEGWLKIDKSAPYNSGNYTFTLSLKNNGGGNMKIEKLLIDFPINLQYVAGSTSGNITFTEPDVIGTPEMGITVLYEIPSPFYNIGPGDTEGQVFQLSGPPGIAVVDAHSVVKASREDVGTVWDADSKPYKITAQATTPEGETLSIIEAGFWKGANIEISCWQVTP